MSRNFYRALFFFFSFTTAMLFPSEAFAQVGYAVTSTGQLVRFDVTTPGTLSSSTAITGLVGGDTIVVRAGTFAGAKFSRSGTFNAPIVLSGEAGAVIASPGPLNTNGDNLWIRNASYDTVEGLELRSAPRAGIAVQAEPSAESHGVVIRICNAQDNTRLGLFSAYAEGILIENNTTAFSAIEHGIYVSNSADNPVATVDARSKAFGTDDAQPLGVQTSVGTLEGGRKGPMPYRRSQQDWAPASRAPKADVLVLEATNLASVTVDVQRARLSCDARLDVETDGPLAVHLDGCGRTATFSTSG
jgi:hypothetical protein